MFYVKDYDKSSWIIPIAKLKNIPMFNVRFIEMNGKNSPSAG